MVEIANNLEGRGVSVEFGYYPHECILNNARFTLETLPTFEASVSAVKGDPDVIKDWIYPGAQRHRDFMTGKLYEMPYRARVFGLPKTHKLTLLESSNSEDLDFVVWWLSFILGMRLTTTEAGFLDATPIKSGVLVDFILLGSPGDAIKVALDYLQSETADPRATKRVAAVIHALFLAQYPQNLPFERFQYLYMALDACYRLVYKKSNKTKDVPHKYRIHWACETLGIPVPDWAEKDTGANELADVRNDTFHEALFFGEPLGFAIYGGNQQGSSADGLLLQMQALICRMLVAIVVGSSVGYVASGVGSRQMHGIELSK